MSDVDKILDGSNQGWDFFTKHIPNLKKENKPFKDRENEGTPSARVTSKGGRYIFKDFGGGDKKGMDVFEFARKHYNLPSIKDFPTVLQKMAAELNISLDKKPAPISYKRPEYRTPEEAQYDKMVEGFANRKISKSIVEEFGLYVTKGYNPATKQNSLAVVFPYTKDGELVNNKMRYKYKDEKGVEHKTFTQESQAEQIPFGFDKAEGKKTCVVVEGEVDTLSGYEALSQIDQVAMSYKAQFGKDLPEWIESVGVISPPNGSGDTLHCLTNVIDWLDQVETFIVFADNDVAGEKLRTSLCERLPSAKVKVVKTYHGCNDSNEILCKRGAIYLLNSFVTAEYLPIKDIYTIDDTRQKTLDFVAGRTKMTEPLGWKLDKTWRPMPGTVTLVTGVPLSGKSTLVTNLVAKALSIHNYPVLWYGAEEPREIKQARFVATFFGTPYIHGTDEHKEKFVEVDFDYAMDAIDDLVYWYEPEENADVKALEVKIKEMHYRMGIGIVVVDPFTHIESSKGQDRKETVRELLTMANRVAKELNIHIIIVAHPTKLDMEKVGDVMVYKKVMPYNVAESSHWFNGVAFMLGTYIENPDLPVTEVYSMKIKFPFDGMKMTSMRFEFNIACNRFFAEGIKDRNPFYRTILDEDLGFPKGTYNPNTTLRERTNLFLKQKFLPKNTEVYLEEEVSTTNWSSKKFEPLEPDQMTYTNLPTQVGDEESPF